VNKGVAVNFLNSQSGHYMGVVSFMLRLLHSQGERVLDMQIQDRKRDVPQRRFEPPKLVPLAKICKLLLNLLMHNGNKIKITSILNTKFEVFSGAHTQKTEQLVILKFRIKLQVYNLIEK
jgi:hypothetical protein